MRITERPMNEAEFQSWLGSAQTKGFMQVLKVYAQQSLYNLYQVHDEAKINRTIGHSLGIDTISKLNYETYKSLVEASVKGE